ncbi:aliphatic sulfonate ABC transporter substrate-binding protein [Rhizobiaceae sp. 2RAB30]
MVKRRFFLSGLMGAAVLAGAFSTLGAHAGEAPKEFRIGYQKGSAILVVAKQQQVFEKRLKALGIDNVRWVEFQFGPPLLEALGAGAVDIGVVGDTPPIFAQAAGANLVYVASAPASASAILVPKASSIQTVADLKGKKVAIAKGSSSHNLTVQALAKHGLSFADIEPVYLSPADAVAAFATGRVDAWTIWDPYFAIAESKHDARVIATSEEEGLGSNSFYLANKDFAQRHPDVLKAALEEVAGVSSWAAQNRDRLAEISAEVTGVDLASQTVASKRYVIDIQPISDGVVASQQKIADTFLALGLIPKAINVREIVWSAPTN